MRNQETRQAVNQETLDFKLMKVSIWYDNSKLQLFWNYGRGYWELEFQVFWRVLGNWLGSGD